ncbi:cytochrome b/b6 domain-containing protein [Novosphingobium pokkalii]|uniref:Cytochrome b/b6 domain-containing protein n=1 Tax=Novosphingobium pokkalii TaxID=1770194 RepID=A0ABV7V282_9SPHN|nr:cytochrome b/b6 domain-containing protein [Novosphingobium pokkalii]GHC81937.1 hypothetical protein GCM10019060_00170 [Novosphingobium pokkalii]
MERSPLILRIRWPVRLWHWINALTVFIMLMSGMMIFNAHPRLYWGKFGANFDHAWLEIGNHGAHGYLALGGQEWPTTGVLGFAQGIALAFPPLVTLPSHYNLALARGWHFLGAWTLVASLVCFLLYALLSGHLRRDLGLSREERRPRALLHDIGQHLRLRLPRGEAARHYNPLQKLAYLSVLLAVLPLLIATGLAMSPTMNAALPWLLDGLGGRQSARSIHFLCALAMALFIAVHLAMVVLAGPLNELRAMSTGWYRLPPERKP